MLKCINTYWYLIEIYFLKYIKSVDFYTRFRYHLVHLQKFLHPADDDERLCEQICEQIL